METLILSIVAAAIFGYGAAILNRVTKIESKQESTFAQILESLSTLSDRLDSIEWRLLTDEQRKSKRFEWLPTFTLSDVRKLANGSELQLATKSYYYPMEEPVFDQFEYQHGSVSDTEGEFGFEVHGFSRENANSDWKPYQFLAKADECTTSTCGGTVKGGRL